MHRLTSIARSFSHVTKNFKFAQNSSTLLVTFDNEANLNALNHQMVNDLKEKISSFKPGLLILAPSATSKAFCAGGDVKSILSAIEKKNFADADQFFADEYALDFALARLNSKSTTTVALWKGHVMGGGVGVSINSTFRVAFNDSNFAMPEARIGIFPDVGVTSTLSRMHRSLALSIGLFGHRLSGADLYLSGLATHFVDSSKFEAVKEELKSLQIDNGKQLQKSVEKILNSYSSEPDEAVKSRFESMVKAFDSALNKQTLEEIQESLDHASDPVLKRLADAMKINSPMSMRLFFEYLKWVHGKSLDQVFEADYRLIKQLLRNGEFETGVKNLLVDKSKDRPKWKFNTIKDFDENMAVEMINTDLKSTVQLKLQDVGN